MPESIDTTPLWVAVHTLGSAGHATIEFDGYTAHPLTPSLWDQSTAALYGQGEIQSGSGATLARERSAADLDLIELRAQIVESVRAELTLQGEPVRTDGKGRPAEFEALVELRRLAWLVIKNTPHNIGWWAHRLASFGRALESHMHLGKREPRPVRLRNTMCPSCGNDWVVREANVQGLVDQRAELARQPAIAILFEDEAVAGAHCEACGRVWARSEMVDFAELVNPTALGI